MNGEFESLVDPYTDLEKGIPDTETPPDEYFSVTGPEARPYMELLQEITSYLTRWYDVFQLPEYQMEHTTDIGFSHERLTERWERGFYIFPFDLHVIPLHVNPRDHLKRGLVRVESVLEVINPSYDNASASFSVCAESMQGKDLGLIDPYTKQPLTYFKISILSDNSSSSLNSPQEEHMSIAAENYHTRKQRSQLYYGYYYLEGEDKLRVSKDKGEVSFTSEHTRALMGLIDTLIPTLS